MSLLITAQEAEARLERSEIVYRRLGQGSDDSPRPRGELAKHGLPGFVREIISAEEKAGFKDVDIASSWGVSPTTVRYAGEGRIGAHQKLGEEKELETRSKRLSGQITEQILDETTDKLLETMKAIKIDPDEKAITQTVIARNLATVLEKVAPKAIQQTNIQYNVFVPTVKSLDDFGPAITVVEESSKR